MSNLNRWVSVTASADGESIGERVWQAEDFFHAVEQIKDADLLAGFGGDEVLVSLREEDLPGFHGAEDDLLLGSKELDKVLGIESDSADDQEDRGTGTRLHKGHLMPKPDSDDDFRIEPGQ